MNKPEASFAVQFSLFNKEYVVIRLPAAVYHRLPLVVQNNLHEFKYFLKFIVVGTTGATVHLGILNFLHYFVWKQTWNIMLYPSVVIAFSTAVVNNYTWNILWTYRHQDHSDQHHVTLFKFTMVSLLGLLINLGIVYLFTDLLNFYWLVGTLVAMGVVMFWNFLANRLWTFKD